MIFLSSCQTLHSLALSKVASNSGLASYHCICPSGLSGLHCEKTQTLQANLKESKLTLFKHHLVGLNFKSGIQCNLAHKLLNYDLDQQLKKSKLNYQTMEKTNANVCLNRGLCLDTQTGPRCLCHSGWHGSRCEHDVDECFLVRKFYQDLQIMLKPSQTIQRKQIKWLESRASYTGGLCSPYGSGRGVCLNQWGSYKCNCSVGFNGQHCQSKVRPIFCLN